VRLSKPKISNYCRIIVLIAGALSTVGCGDEQARVRVTQNEVVGAYEAQFDDGREILELKNDQTYVQDFRGQRKTIHHVGSWKIEDHFLSGSNVILVSCVVSDRDKGTTPERLGDRTLNAHRRSGQIALALNEAADWYFVRVLAGGRP
jgi:hypothetical protein